MTEPNPQPSECIFCGSSRSTLFCKTSDLFQNQFEIRQCKDCRAYYLWPFPSQEILAKAYDVSYYGTNETKFKAGPIEKVLDAFRKQRSNNIARKLPSRARILDIGCGNGNFLEFLSAINDFELHGIERDMTAAARAMSKQGMTIKTTPLEAGDYPGNYFDAITLFHVFEHLTNPAETMLIIDQILKPGGILYLSFPNIDSLQARWFKGKWLHLDPPRHLLFFRPKDFIELMKQRNFTCRKVTYISLEQNPFGMVQSLLNLFLKKREVLFERLKGNMEYASEYGKFSIFMQKVFFMVSFPVFVIHDILVSLLHKGATVTFMFQKK
jgi:2-polyprenyl-3-methyl-5-hydroxy-6-metoxy-1,4-benzoquinol methylase